MANNKNELVVTLSLVSLNLVKTTISRAIYTKTKSSRADNNLCLYFTPHYFSWIQAKQTPHTAQ